MHWSYIFALPAALTSAVWAATSSASNDYSEQLHLKPLPGGALYAGFTFAASTSLKAYEAQNFRYFPRSLAQILQFTHTSELHVRFALGRWDEGSWGSRPRSGRQEGGTGVELWAWIEADAKGDAEERWNDLVNSLSGFFCASLNFIDQTKTTQPILSFEPDGTTRGNASRHLMHGMLPHEIVCTENLTPFLKLLPCKGKAGVSSLLDGHKVFDANWQTMAIDVRPVCAAEEDCRLELSQTVDMVLDLERSMRPRENPIPRPPPIEQVSCDESKAYNAPDTCYPKYDDQKTDWSLTRIFGRPIQGSCPVGDRSEAADIVIETFSGSEIVTDAESVPNPENGASNLMLLRLAEGKAADVSSTNEAVVDTNPGDAFKMQASRQMIGYGQERGGMHIVITNSSPQTQRIIYLETLPWFLRPYMHTLSVTGATLTNMFYMPARDRRKGTQLELQLDIPAFSAADVTYDFEKAILRYTEYPPDANRGFDVAPAVIRVMSLTDSDGHEDSYLRTTSLLLPLPTPDFSMPYNVIILTSTVIALGFGSIFNLLTRRFILLKELPSSPLAAFVNNIRERVKGTFLKIRGEPGPKSTSCDEIPDKLDEIGLDQVNGNADLTGIQGSSTLVERAHSKPMSRVVKGI